MKYLLRIFSTAEDFDGNVGAALIDIKPELAKVILRRMKDFAKAKEKDKDFAEALYDERECCYLDHSVVNKLLTEEQLENLWNYGFIATEVDCFDAGRTDMEGCLMAIGGDYVQWQAYPEFSSVSLSTGALEKNLIEELIEKDKKDG